MLPSNLDRVEKLRAVARGDVENSGTWETYFEPNDVQNLLYNLRLVDELSKPGLYIAREGFNEAASQEAAENFSREFVSSGGLSHLMTLLTNRRIHWIDGDNVVDEWSLECLSYLMKVVLQFSSEPIPAPSPARPPQQQRVQDSAQGTSTSGEGNGSSEVGGSSSSEPQPMVISPTRKQARTSSRRTASSGATSEPVIARLSSAALESTSPEALVDTVMDIVYKVALPRTSQQHFYPWIIGRLETLRNALSFLIPLLHSSPEGRVPFMDHGRLAPWLKRPILEAPEAMIRKEATTFLTRLCKGTLADAKSTGYIFIMPILSALLGFLKEAAEIPPSRRETASLESMPVLEGKADKMEMYGPNCSDYFGMVTSFVDMLHHEDIVATWRTDQDSYESKMATWGVNFNELTIRVAQLICEREFYETRPLKFEDEGLIGLLGLCKVLVSHDAPLKRSEQAACALIDELFGYLFGLPTDRMKRHLPKCKSPNARTTALDLLSEIVKSCDVNYLHLCRLLRMQHCKDTHDAYPWEYWPQDDARSPCGYVGLVNLGATCYMATCLQHLFMMPDLRRAVLQTRASPNYGHKEILGELQKLFAFLQESERKAYNPRSFCSVYSMDQQQINTGEQKDMTEFYNDLISKLEEMSPDLKRTVKRLFGGEFSNCVVSLDCAHVSRRPEAFYNVTCKVSGMKNLYESLSELTGKDILEGDNKYICEKCQTKVRAEKRTCFKRLPQILCINTMRYTFEMACMRKEKVNTLFSFPMELDMTDYMEHTLLGPDKCKDETQSGGTPSDSTKEEKTSEGASIDPTTRESCRYVLTGVTVHTGTADGGHYYSFIRDQTTSLTGPAKWFLFNDAEIKTFDPINIAAECFGGAQSKPFESGNDFGCYENKNNSAYMLFYERVPADSGAETSSSAAQPQDKVKQQLTRANHVELPDELANWLWRDNCSFIRDCQLFEPLYLNFMFQVCICQPRTLGPGGLRRVQLTTAQLSCSFFLETLIHAKEKPNTYQWIEQFSKMFTQCPEARIWFLNYLGSDDWWPTQFLFNCPNKVVREIFCRLVLEVVRMVIEAEANSPTPSQTTSLGAPSSSQQPQTSDTAGREEEECSSDESESQGQSTKPCKTKASQKCGKQRKSSGSASSGTGSCSVHGAVASFLSQVVGLMEPRGSGVNLRHMNDLFLLLFNCANLSPALARLLLEMHAIARVMHFYVGFKQESGKVCVNKMDDFRNVLMGPLRGPPRDLSGSSSADTLCFPLIGATGLHAGKSGGTGHHRSPLEHMLMLVVNLVQASRDSNGDIRLPPEDYAALLLPLGGSPADAALAAMDPATRFPFFYYQIRENISLRHTSHLLVMLIGQDWSLMEPLIDFLMQSAAMSDADHFQYFFRVLSSLLEFRPQGAAAPLAPESTGGLPSDMHALVLSKLWPLAESSGCCTLWLEWLLHQVVRHPGVAEYVVASREVWMEKFLLGHPVYKVRMGTYSLILQLLPAPIREHIASGSTPAAVNMTVSSGTQQQPPSTLTPEQTATLHKIYSHLLSLLPRLKEHLSTQLESYDHLVAYFNSLSACLWSITEKEMFAPYFTNMWELYYPGINQPEVPVYHDKQAFLMFLHNVCKGCPKNLDQIVKNPVVASQIPFNYILADIDDNHVTNFNRLMLPHFFGLLRLCCDYSSDFVHIICENSSTNIEWSCRFIAPYHHHYTVAVDELFKLLESMTRRDGKVDEVRENFRKKLIQLFCSIEPPHLWTPLQRACNLLLETNADRVFLASVDGLAAMANAFSTLYHLYYQASACHVAEDLVQVLEEMVRCLRAALEAIERRDPEFRIRIFYRQTRTKAHLIEMASRAMGMLNFFVHKKIRTAAIEFLKELLNVYQADILPILVTQLGERHKAFATIAKRQDLLGPYFPRRGSSERDLKSRVGLAGRPGPMFGMTLHPADLEAARGVHPDYDGRMDENFYPYYYLVDRICRVAINVHRFKKDVISLSVMVAKEAALLHCPLFAKLWLEIHRGQATDKTAITLLCQDPQFTEYMILILSEQRTSMTSRHIAQFMTNFYPKVHSNLLTVGSNQLSAAMIKSLLESRSQICAHIKNMPVIARLLLQVEGDLRALLLIASTPLPTPAGSDAQSASSSASACVTPISGLRVEVNMVDAMLLVLRGLAKNASPQAGTTGASAHTGQMDTSTGASAHTGQMDTSTGASAQTGQAGTEEESEEAGSTTSESPEDATDDESTSKRPRLDTPIDPTSAGHVTSRPMSHLRVIVRDRIETIVSVIEQLKGLIGQENREAANPSEASAAPDEPPPSGDQ